MINQINHMIKCHDDIIFNLEKISAGMKENIKNVGRQIKKIYGFENEAELIEIK